MHLPKRAAACSGSVSCPVFPVFPVFLVSPSFMSPRRGVPVPAWSMTSSNLAFGLIVDGCILDRVAAQSGSRHLFSMEGLRVGFETTFGMFWARCLYFEVLADFLWLAMFLFQGVEEKRVSRVLINLESVDIQNARTQHFFSRSAAWDTWTS